MLKDEMTDERLDVIECSARRLVDVRRGEASPFKAMPNEGPQNRAEAYAVQERVIKIIGAKVGAWKVGGPLSGHPMMAPILSGDVMENPIDLESREVTGIECEIAYLLASDLPPRTRAYTSADIEPAIAAVLPVIETVTARIDAFASAPVFWKLADNQVNGGLVLGKRCTNWSAALWRDASIKLEIDGQETRKVSGGNPGGDGLGLLLWLANNQSTYGNRRSGGLKAGQIVTTGSYTGLDMVAPGKAIQADFGPLGSIELTI